MKKLILFTLTFTLLVLSSCQSPVLYSGEYEIVDTTYTSKNSFNQELGHHVIIKYDSSYYYGKLSEDGILIDMDHRKIDLSIFE